MPRLSEAIYAAIEPERHRHEVDYVLALISHKDMARFMDGVEKHRGAVAANRLRADVRAIILERRSKVASARAAVREQLK